MDARQRLAAEYSAKSVAYARHWSQVIRPMALPLLQALPLRMAGRILDVGAGTGALLTDLKSAAPGAIVIGVDRAEGMLRFALLVGVVLLPLMSLARAVVGPGRPWLLGAMGVAAAPIQGFVLLIGGRIMFQGSPHMRPTLMADAAALAGHPGDAAVLLGAFAAGGLAFGVWAASPGGRSIKADTPANTQMEPTRVGS